MKRLGTLLSSAARTEILRALYYQTAPIGLRQLARLSGVLPRSAELALDALANERLIGVTHGSAGPRYALNREHADAAVLAAVFTAATRTAIASRSRKLGKRAIRLFAFIEEADSILAIARGSYHVA